MSLNKTGSTLIKPVAITVLIIIILAIMVALLAVALYFLTSNSKMHATFSWWRKRFSSKSKLQTMHYITADKAGGGKRSSDCSQLEYVSYREEDMHRQVNYKFCNFSWTNTMFSVVSIITVLSTKMYIHRKIKNIVIIWNLNYGFDQNGLWVLRLPIHTIW